jgi:hypothetical protein
MRLLILAPVFIALLYGYIFINGEIRAVTVPSVEDKGTWFVAAGGYVDG